MPDGPVTAATPVRVITPGTHAGITETASGARPSARKTVRPAGGGSLAGRADRKTAPAGNVATLRPNSATYLRCGGCGTSSVFIQSERRYGQEVRDFLDQHDLCGGAVEISAAQQSASQSADHSPLASGPAAS